MRQVPKYLLIGNGRVSRHFQHYFSLSSIPYDIWHRQEPLEKLNQYLEQATHILILISDKAIEEFITNHLQHTNALKIHFSGSLVTSHAYGAHPLLGFNRELYSLDEYQSFSFVLDHDAPDFETLLPSLTNQHARLDKSLKPKYHALCVLGGNFSTLLWQKFFNGLVEDLNLPADIGQAYLRRNTQNILQDFNTALTGPLTRNDHTTLQKNIQALESDPFQEIYRSFVRCYQQIKNEEVV